VGIVSIAVLAVTAIILPKIPHQAMKQAEIDQNIQKRKRPPSVTISNLTWHKEGFDNVLVASFTIDNANAFPVNDIEISCDEIDPSGTKLGTTSRTILNVIDPHGSKTVIDFDMGYIHSQTKSTRCLVSGFQQ
jgi:hypothetical protein